MVQKLSERGYVEAVTKISNFFELKALPIAITILVVGFAYSSVLLFITAYAADIHLVKAGSLFFLAYAIVVLLSRPITGKWIDRKGGNSVAYPTLIIFAIGMLVLSQTRSSVVFLLAAALVGLGPFALGYLVPGLGY
ncbi:putative transporter [compost metagenome]